ncbi:MAG: NAD(P)H-hydrate epimerase, partial [Actinobacteria bacterium]|nr:NAD(P)H-hydrate epimerase [Actinomycetota bacterium]
MSEVPLLDAAAARVGDERAVDAGGSWARLMERAAGHLARGVVAAAGGRGYGGKVAILVGKGNNGGDGWAAARRLRSLGAAAWVVAVPGVDAGMSDEATENRRRWIDAGGRTSSGLADLDAALDWADVAVDALLGTGIDGAPRGDVGVATRALLRAHERGLTVVACDIPSGVSSDDGSAPEGAVRADLTVTFGGWKRGLLLHPGAAHAGRVVVGELGPSYDPPTVAWRALTAVGAAPARLGDDTDKRARGVVKIVAGSVGSGGAAVLCARGALAAGAGLLTLATPAHVQRVIVPVIPPAMTEPLAHAGEAISPKGAAQLELAGVDVVAAGPGLTPGEGTYALARRLLAEAPRVVLDADALNVFRDDPSALADHAGDLVLTPHERELARIGGGSDGEDAWGHRVERVPALAEEYGATIVAKGPGTIVAAPDGRVWVCPTGSPALGS